MMGQKEHYQTIKSSRLRRASPVKLRLSSWLPMHADGQSACHKGLGCRRKGRLLARWECARCERGCLHGPPRCARLAVLAAVSVHCVVGPSLVEYCVNGVTLSADECLPRVALASVCELAATY